MRGTAGKSTLVLHSNNANSSLTNWLSGSLTVKRFKVPRSTSPNRYGQAKATIVT